MLVKRLPNPLDLELPPLLVLAGLSLALKLLGDGAPTPPPLPLPVRTALFVRGTRSLALMELLLKCDLAPPPPARGTRALALRKSEVLRGPLAAPEALPSVMVGGCRCGGTHPPPPPPRGVLGSVGAVFTRGTAGEPGIDGIGGGGLVTSVTVSTSMEKLVLTAAVDSVFCVVVAYLGF